MFGKHETTTTTGHHGSTVPTSTAHATHPSHTTHTTHTTPTTHATPGTHTTPTTHHHHGHSDPMATDHQLGEHEPGYSAGGMTSSHHQPGMTTATHPGPASKTAGPHRSNLMNKMDPRVDSHAVSTTAPHSAAIPGSTTMAGTHTGRSNDVNYIAARNEAYGNGRTGTADYHERAPLAHESGLDAAHGSHTRTHGRHHGHTGLGHSTHHSTVPSSTHHTSTVPSSTHHHTTGMTGTHHTHTPGTTHHTAGTHHTGAPAYAGESAAMSGARVI